jgi:uncharacterized membrane protein YbhN (UPF0104 family)
LKNNKLYKYINLLLRITIGIATLWFIYTKLKTHFLLNLQKLFGNEINYILIFIAFLMLFLNWGIEAVKWKYSISRTEKISIFKAFKLTITGVTLGLITPNRIGEIPSRALLLNRNLFKEITLKTSVASFSQLIITLFVGSVGLFLTLHHFNINLFILLVVLIISTLILLLIYFKVNKIEKLFYRIKYFRENKTFRGLSEFSSIELINILLMSLLRYIVFYIQFYIILYAFGIPLTSMSDFMLISVCFMFASFIPTILISEIGVRGTVAIFVFGTISDLEFQIIMASILLWLINVALPALLGLFNLKGVKILKEN